MDIEFFNHALTWLKTHEDYVPDILIQLRPTSPIRFKADIDHCVEMLISNPEADSLRVVTKAPATPYKMWELSEEEPFMNPLLTLKGVKEPFNQPRQKLPVIYWQVGTLDVIKIETLTHKKSLSGEKIIPFVIPSEYAVDIDDMEAFERAANIIGQTDCIKV